MIIPLDSDVNLAEIESSQQHVLGLVHNIQNVIAQNQMTAREALIASWRIMANHSIYHRIHMHPIELARRDQLPNTFGSRNRVTGELFIDGFALESELNRRKELRAACDAEQALARLVDQLSYGSDRFGDQTNQAFAHALYEAVRVVDRLERLFG